MAARIYFIRVGRVESHHPHTPARQLKLLRIDPLPVQPGVLGVVHAAVVLERGRDEHFVRVPRVYQDAGEIAERQIRPAPQPRAAAVAAGVERVDRADVNVIRPLGVDGDRADRHILGRAAELLPGFAIVTRYDNARRGRADPNRAGHKRRHSDREYVLVDAFAERDLFPTLREVVGAVKTAVRAREKAVLIVFGVRQDADLFVQHRVKLLARYWIDHGVRV